MSMDVSLDLSRAFGHMESMMVYVWIVFKQVQYHEKPTGILEFNKVVGNRFDASDEVKKVFANDIWEVKLLKAASFFQDT